MAGTGHAL